MNQYLEVKENVQEAINEGRAVIALESTIIAHGMPYPDNVKTAKHIEDIISQAGAVPATIAIMDGKIKVGLNEEELLRMATEKGIVKASRRDLAHVLASGLTASTTVAATMICASMAGIKFFVTGGIGGVHREYPDTMDVSADMDELATTDVTVICAGAKGILDLPRTMEYLETKGVPVIGYGTDELPAFYTRTSGIQLQIRKDSPEEVAEMLRVKDQLGLKGGVLVTVPIPEEDSMDPAYINQVIDQALQLAEDQGVTGKDITPFLLSTIVEKTGGKSLEANEKLVFNNARVGSAIALAYAKMAK